MSLNQLHTYSNRLHLSAFARWHGAVERYRTLVCHRKLIVQTMCSLYAATSGTIWCAVSHSCDAHSEMSESFESFLNFDIVDAKRYAAYEIGMCVCARGNGSTVTMPQCVYTMQITIVVVVTRCIFLFTLISMRWMREWHRSSFSIAWRFRDSTLTHCRHFVNINTFARVQPIFACTPLLCDTERC